MVRDAVLALKTKVNILSYQECMRVQFIDMEIIEIKSHGHFGKKMMVKLTNAFS